MEQLRKLEKLSSPTKEGGRAGGRAGRPPTKEARRAADAREEADDPEQQRLLESADAYREANLMNLAFSGLREHVRFAFVVALFNDQLCRQAFGAWIENAYAFAEERAKMESALIFFRGVTMDFYFERWRGFLARTRHAKHTMKLALKLFGTQQLEKAVAAWQRAVQVGKEKREIREYVVSIYLAHFKRRALRGWRDRVRWKVKKEQLVEAGAQMFDSKSLVRAFRDWLGAVAERKDLAALEAKGRAFRDYLLKVSAFAAFAHNRSRELYERDALARAVAHRTRARLAAGARAFRASADEARRHGRAAAEHYRAKASRRWFPAFGLHRALQADAAGRAAALRARVDAAFLRFAHGALVEAVSLQKEATRRRGLAEAHRRGVLARKGYLAWRDNTPRVDTIVTLFKVADTMRRLSLLKFAYFKMKLAADITCAGKALGLTHFRGNQLKHCWRRWRERVRDAVTACEQSILSVNHFARRTTKHVFREWARKFTAARRARGKRLLELWYDKYAARQWVAVSHFHTALSVSVLYHWSRTAQSCRVLRMKRQVAEGMGARLRARGALRAWGAACGAQKERRALLVCFLKWRFSVGLEGALLRRGGRGGPPEAFGEEVLDALKEQVAYLRDRLEARPGSELYPQIATWAHNEIERLSLVRLGPQSPLRDVMYDLIYQVADASGSYIKAAAAQVAVRRGLKGRHHGVFFGWKHQVRNDKIKEHLTRLVEACEGGAGQAPP